ncbi:hypothetical protein BOO69_06095 [Sulfitobacter alexandrii]|uniref:Uncharacterized protein n=1 Tax=Sulfitobacter alexandrii TaxID=1917485 RepID=A0A1J0WFD7_9RHOB|nr:hypothetical protein [Sulfitobacter alexandrii]APE43036.1 hypothetical protein BOO69_06095 [Sulfitobacter alexandrii]
MTGADRIPGSSVVGHLTDIPLWEAELILSMRLWRESPEGQAEVSRGFARCYGPAGGAAETRGFDRLLGALCRHARRPLTWHGLGCSCIGADEAVLQTFVREAAQGDLAEAAMIASLIAPAAQAEHLALMAAQVGRAMQGMARSAPPSRPGRPGAATPVLH